MATPKEERVVEIIVNGQKANASLKEMAAAAAVLSNQVAKIAADDPRRAELISQLQQMRQRITDTRAEVAGLVQTQEQLAAAQAATVAEQVRAIAAGKASTASLSEMRAAAGLLEKQLHELSANDPGRAALIADYQALKARMGAARQEIEVTTKSEAQLRAEQDALRASQVQLVVNGQKVSASMREMREAAAHLEKELDDLAHDDLARGPLIAGLQQMKARLKDVQQEVAGVAETSSHMRQVMTYAFGSVVGGGIEGLIGKVVETGKSIFETTAKFETYGVVLEKALGSKSLAQRALADIQQMAASTPFSVDELTSSFLKFVNRGLTPSMAEMTKLGDLASSQGKSFDQLTEAVLDAGTGEFERLKEFGIAASKSGDQVTLSFKGVQQTVANTPEAINAAILAFGEAKGVMGGMEAISHSLAGSLSNVGDTADQVAVEWGQTLRPVFAGVLSTLGFLLGVLGAIPGFIKENRGLLLGLAGAVVTLNFSSIAATASTLAHIAAERARAIATRASAAAQWLLNVAMTANPIGLVVAAVALLVGVFVTLYERSEKVRAVVAGLGAAFMAFVTTLKNGVLQQLSGIGDLLVGIFTMNPEKIKQGLADIGGSIKAIYYDAGKNAAAAYGKGYDEKMTAEMAASAEKQGNLFDQFARNYQKRLDAALKARVAAEATARLERLQNEEANLKERLAKVKEDSEQEMRLKQQLITNAANQELEDTKKTAVERRIILAEAEQKRLHLVQEFYEKQAKQRKEHRDKVLLAEIEAEKLHQEMLTQVRQAAIAARGDELVTELSKIYTDGELKIAALQATAKKEIVQLTGSAKEKAARTLDLEKKLAAEIALVRAEVLKKQGELTDKANEETYKKLQEDVNRKVEAEEKSATRLQDAILEPFHASLKLQQDIEEQRYNIRQAAFERELALVEGALGKESAEYRKVFAAQEKDQREHNKRKTADEEKAWKAKQALQRMEMQTAGAVLDFALQLLDQDAEARQKHHALYVALAAAKVIVDGVVEVQNIWEKSSEFGPAGIALAVVQTALAVARTTVALAQLRGTGGSDSAGSYAQGGATGTGKSLVGSPMGQLLSMTGMRVAGDGRLRDGSGFAVAGVVHEDEYVIPKWQLQDPQVAAVAQWLEARRVRGFADGGPTGSGSSGATLPVAAASPATDGEKVYAVLAQMLDANRAMVQQLAGVEKWQRELQVRLDLRAAQAGLDAYKQVQHSSAIRSKG